MTWGDSLILNEQLLLALEMCNQDKAAIRQIEEQKNDEKNQRRTTGVPRYFVPLNRVNIYGEQEENWTAK